MVIPEHLRLTPDEEAELESIRVQARANHERKRKAAKQRGRHDFPSLPFECSWAFETQFLSEKLKAKKCPYCNGVKSFTTGCFCEDNNGR